MPDMTAHPVTPHRFDAARSPRIPKRALRAVVLIAWTAGSTLAGEIEGLAIPYRSVTISSPLQEVVKEVLVEEGERVAEGQVLAHLLDDQEHIEYKRAAKVLEKREFDYRASAELAKDKLISREKALETEAELEIAQLDLDLAQTLLEQKAIRSPISGVVVRKFKEAGEAVDRVEPMFAVEDNTRIYVQFYVPPPVARRLAPGAEIRFSMEDLPDEELSAPVDFISPSADPASGLFRIKLLFDNTGEKIRAGLRASGRFPD